MLPLINLHQQRIIEFIQEEFSKIKDLNSQRKINKKIKLKTIEKQIKKLLTDIELILKITSISQGIKDEIIIFKKDVENYRYKI